VNRRSRRGSALRRSALVVCALCASAAVVGKAGETPVRAENPALSAEQMRAVGITVARPLAAHGAERVAALGVVLDTASLIADQGEWTAAMVTERVSAGELKRLQALHAAGVGGSDKSIDAARAEQIRAWALRETAAARFASAWGPLAKMRPARREELTQALRSGRSLLVRAEVPGRRSWGTLPVEALLDVDGLQVSGRVLGVQARTGDSQGGGLLIQVPQPPVGLGPGARMPVALVFAQNSGLWVPRDALVFDQSGAYVYRQEPHVVGDGKIRYMPVKVEPFMALGDGWLVKGLTDAEAIVMRGAGVLWSLQGMSSTPTDED
jgi:hypothetical protein